MAYAIIKTTKDGTPGLFKCFSDEFVEKRVDFTSEDQYNKWYADLAKECKTKSEATDIFTAEIFNDQGLVKSYCVEDFLDDPELYGDATKIDFSSLDKFCTQTWEELNEMEKLIAKAQKEVD